MSPPSRFRAHTGWCAIDPDLLIVQQQRARRVDVKGDSQRLADIGIFDGKLPRQENLGAIPIRQKIGAIESGAVPVNHSMRLAGVEYHHCAPA